MVAYWDLIHVCVAGMPPKKRMVEPRGEDELERETSEPVAAVSSPASSASSVSAGSCESLISEQLEQILVSNQKAMLEANHQSMTALLASLSASSAAGSGTARVPQIKIPKWTDEETPFEYFGKFEKALTHNGVPKSSWGQLLPVYLAGRAQAALAQVDSESLEQGRIQGGFVGFGQTPLITNCTKKQSLLAVKVFKLALNTSKVGFWKKQIIKNDNCLLFSCNFIIRPQLQSSVSIVSCCDHRKMTGSLFFLWAELATGAHFTVN